MMEKLVTRKGIENDRRLTVAYNKMFALLEVISKKEITSEVTGLINVHIKKINTFTGTNKELTKTLRNAHAQILQLLKEKLKIVPKNHYMGLWMIFGLLAGIIIPFFFNVFGLTERESSSGMGISIGIVFGLVVGIFLDRRAKQKGKQLDL